MKIFFLLGNVVVVKVILDVQYVAVVKCVLGKM